MNDTSTTLAQQIAEVRRMAESIFSDAASAQRWFAAPNFVFNGHPPADYLDTEEDIAAVRQVLTAIATGGPV